MNIFEHNRIMIIGNNGGGKSTLAKGLAAITGLPLVHLDAIYWLPDLQAPPEDEWLRLHAEIIAGEKWVIDGNYRQGGTLEPRWAAADLVIHLEVNRLVCLAGAVIRNCKARPDDGPREFKQSFDRRFFTMCRAIWDYSRARRDKLLAPRERYPDTPFFVIKGRRNMRRLLKEWNKEAQQC